MRQVTGKTLAALIFLVTTCVLSTGPQAKDGASKSGAIVGQVLDLQGRPLAAADVWAVEFREVVGRTKTDDQGRFRLEPLKEDKSLTIWAEAEDLARERRENVHVFAGKDHDLGAFVLSPGTRIHARAIDAQGKPIAGAKVTLKVYRHELGHTINSAQTEWTLATDSLGRFGTPPLPAGGAELTLAAPGKVRVHRSQVSLPGAILADLGDVPLEDESPIRGVVVDQDGNPAPNVEIITDYDHDNVTRSDELGRFTILGVGKDAKDLWLQSNDYFAANPVSIAKSGTDLRLTVRKAYTISASAVDAETDKLVPVETVRLCMVRREPDGSVVLLG
jgi:uncharacterized GH25 family protein